MQNLKQTLETLKAWGVALEAPANETRTVIEVDMSQATPPPVEPSQVSPKVRVVEYGFGLWLEYWPVLGGWWLLCCQEDDVFESVSVAEYGTKDAWRLARRLMEGLQNDHARAAERDAGWDPNP
jgi:hypothetical protein